MAEISRDASLKNEVCTRIVREIQKAAEQLKSEVCLNDAFHLTNVMRNVIKEKFKERLLFSDLTNGGVCIQWFT